MTRRPAKKDPGTTRCAIYTRKSTSKGLEQEFNSLDAQREACAAYAKRQPGWTVVETKYDDGGFTGANIERPAFKRLLADIEAGKIDVVVVYKVDRLSRSLLDFAQVMERFNAAGTAFASVTQNFSTADAMGRLTLNMLMSFAEFEREMIGDRTRDKISASRRKGKWTGGRIPFGYTVVDKRLLVDDLEALIIRDAFELFLQHGRAAFVAHALNDSGKFPRGTRMSAGKQRRWTKDAIARVLRNPLYAGLVRSGDERFPGEQAAIVSASIFRRAERIFTGKAKVQVSHGTNPGYVLRGLLRCGQCGAAMSPGSSRSGDAEYRYYRCSTRCKKGREACDASPLPAGAVEAYVVERIATVALDGRLVSEVEKALASRVERRRTALAMMKAKLPGQAATASANASKLAGELTRLTGKARELVAAKLSVEAERAEHLQRQLQSAEQELEDLEGVRADTEWVIHALGAFGKVWEALTLPNRGRLLRALVDRVVVDEASGKAEVHLIDFAVLADSVETKEAA